MKSELWYISGVPFRTNARQKIPNNRNTLLFVAEKTQPLSFLFVHRKNRKRTMEFTISKYVPGTRPDVTLPSIEMLSLLGEEGIRQLVSDHYDLLKESPIKNLFPQDDPGLQRAKKNSADFFVQICGGPMYFSKNRGKPMLYKRHMPHKITPEARIEWLKCYQVALSKHNLPDEVLQSFWKYLDTFSTWMVNS